MTKLELFKLASSISPCIYNGVLVNIDYKPHEVSFANHYYLINIYIYHDCSDSVYFRRWVYRISSLTGIDKKVLTILDFLPLK